MNKDLRNSFLIAFVYVGLGTIALLFIYSTNILVPIILLLTIPVTFIGAAIAYTEKNSMLSVILVQIAMFILLWKILYDRLKKRTQKRNKN